ncbi:MAG: hypothetical protein U5K84_05785 [Alkalibacterium sp.]|nr:hypothetical protein [Alkalibacterium sp.]
MSKKKKQEYETLQTSLKKRKETILRVGTAIIMHQQAFFKDKNASLAPLQLNDLAEELHLNQSTISRAVRDTYIETPYGSFELKSFLSRRSSQSDMSKNHVQQALEQLVKTEDRSRPLSDQALSDALKEKDITLSRRGVSKYRKQLNIPSSKQRKSV